MIGKQQTIRDWVITEITQNINDDRRKNLCARSLHTVDREKGIKDTMKNGCTYCEVCGVMLEWKESEDGVWEFWEKTKRG